MTPVLRELADPPERLAELWLTLAKDDTELIAAWDGVCARVLRDGSIEDLHAARNDYQAVLFGHLQLLDGHLTLLERFGDETRREAIAAQRTRLQQHFDTLFPRWRTQENLEAILLERLRIPNDTLKTLAAKNPPPQSWYDEAGDAP